MQPDDVNNFVQTRLGGFFVFVFVFVFVVFLTYAVIMHKVWTPRMAKVFKKKICVVLLNMFGNVS